MTKITTYIENGRTFIIAKQEAGDGKGYWGIEDKYIDENGKLTKVFNGITGNHSETLAETIQMVSNTIKTEALIEQGWNATEAAIFVITGKRVQVNF